MQSRAARSWLSLHDQLAHAAVDRVRAGDALPAWWRGIGRFGGGTPHDFAATCAATVVSLAAALPALEGAAGAAGWPWLLRHHRPLRALVADALRTCGCPPEPENLPALVQAWGLPLAADREPPPWRVYEQLLEARNRPLRRGRGIYFTPETVAGALAAGVDRALREEFQLARGLADAAPGEPGNNGGPTDPFIQLLDPAAGSGMLLAAALRQARASFLGGGDVAGEESAEEGEEWREFALGSLLPRLVGFEIAPPAWCVAHVHLATVLAAGGCGPPGEMRLQLFLTDALDPEWDVAERPPAADSGDPWGEQAAAALAWKRAAGPSVLLVNPPYRSLTAVERPWIDSLLRGGSAGAGVAARSYYEAEGVPLGRKKLWLHDDYVKFIRWCQWRIDQRGAGIVGMIANRGYLEHPTFRGLREQLLDTFPLVTTLDLGGDLRRGAAGARDEGVFEIGQGIALALWRRPFSGVERRVAYGRLQGPRAGKLALMRETPLSKLAERRVAAEGPAFRLLPVESVPEEYARFDPLETIFHQGGSAAVTARDGVVIGFTEEELLERIARLRDSTVSDETLRRELFPAPRTERYPRGDTRSWKLAEARERLRGLTDWRDCVRPCWYRPWDRRFVFWSPLLIDWPRNEAMRPLLAGGNRALVVRRQSPADREADFFWVSDTPVLDGLLRSDNRGNESFFPLWNERGESNLQPPYLALLAPLAREEGSAERVFAYLYAVLHSPSYRRRYGAGLREGFPRLPRPRTAGLFAALARLGEELMAAHLLQTPPEGEVGAMGRAVVEGRAYPRLVGGRVELGPEGSLAPVSASAWEFRVGSHQPARKWLRDRRGRALTGAELRHYGALLAAADATIHLAARVERAITAEGGWPNAFLLQEPRHA